ncbi:MAG TPA: addiction module protein [Gemmataceae bacterium]|jgi:putative addiction module component (TIGR02574 family)
MSETAESILAAALSLPDDEREALTFRLMELLPAPSGDEVSDEEFAAELLRRKTEMEQGLDDGIPWSELKDMD